MSIDGVITFAVILVILVCVLVFMFELLIPLQVKFDMNGICRTYYLKVEAETELSVDDQNRLIDALNDLGLEEVTIEILGDDRRFGNIVTFVVKGQYKRKRLTHLFIREDVNYTMAYERTCYVRKIKN